MESNNSVSKEKSEKIQIKSFAKYENIKSIYILKKVFANLCMKKKLEIVKNNKNIKRRLNISFNNYKEFSDKYSSIEIEIKPAFNKFGKFINIKEKDEKYCHIYFNNNEEEIKRNYINRNEKIKIVKIILDYIIESFEKLFEYCRCTESINFKKFYRKNINMEYMFSECSSLKELNLNNFINDNVTNMRYMFRGCSSLKELNLNILNTNIVTNMRGLFSGCSSLKEINLSNFNTNNVTDMRGMFNGCSSLKELNLNNFNTNNVTDMRGMFYGCSSLKELNIKSMR